MNSNYYDGQMSVWKVHSLVQYGSTCWTETQVEYSLSGACLGDALCVVGQKVWYLRMWISVEFDLWPFSRLLVRRCSFFCFWSFFFETKFQLFVFEFFHSFEAKFVTGSWKIKFRMKTNNFRSRQKPASEKTSEKLLRMTLNKICF